MSKFELQDKVAIVTGGGGSVHGIGKAVALAYARAGAHVAVVGRTQDSLDAVAAEVAALGRKSVAIVVDVTDPIQADNMVDQTLDAFGRIDIIVNNAGTSASCELGEMTLDIWNDHMALNLSGTLLCSLAAGRAMIAQGSGKIINISSDTGMKGDPSMAAYAAAKAGVINLTKSMAIGWAKHGLAVNCIAPGRVALQEEDIQTDDDGKPMSRLDLPCTPAQVADSAVFLASSGSDLVSGETIVIRGTDFATTY